MIVELDIVLYANEDIYDMREKIVTKAQLTHHIHASPKITRIRLVIFICFLALSKLKFTLKS